MILRENRVRSYTITPSLAPDSRRAMRVFQSGRITRGFHADSELSRKISPTRPPRASIFSVHSSTWSSTITVSPFSGELTVK